MFEVQTVIIYLTLFVIMFLLSKKAVRNKSWKNIIGILLIYSVVFGVRYGVGMDFPSYLESYESNGVSKYSYEVLYEPGFMLIIKILNFLNLHYSFFFGFVAFVQLYYVFKTFKYNFKLYPYLVYTFMIGCVWLDFSNGLRQILALCFFIYSLSLLDKKHWFINCFIYILLAASMHKSAILLIILCVLLHKKDVWFNNLKFQFIAFVLAFIIGNVGFVQQVIEQFDVLLSYMQYDHYLERTDLEDMVEKKVSKGIGFYGILTTDLILVAYSNNVKKYFIYNSYFKRIYNLYFIGVLIRYAFLTSLLIQRVNYYFYFFKFIIAAHTLLYAKKHNKYIFIALMFLFLLYFIGTLSSMEVNTSLYKFFWQTI